MSLNKSPFDIINYQVIRRSQWKKDRHYYSILIYLYLTRKRRLFFFYRSVQAKIGSRVYIYNY